MVSAEARGRSVLIVAVPEYQAACGVTGRGAVLGAAPGEPGEVC